MRLFDVGKVGLTCDAVVHSTEKRKDGEVKIIVLTLRVQPFDVKLAAALHPDVRATLFKLSHPDPQPHLARVNFALGVPRQALDIFATPETARATMRLDHAKITGVYARTEKGMTGYACVFKASFGPVSDKELGFVEAWRNGMKFVSFDEAEPSADFEAEESDDDEEDDEPDDQLTLPAPEFETDTTGRPIDPGEAEACRPLQDLLKQAGAVVLLDQIAAWTEPQRDAAHTWATAQIAAAKKDKPGHRTSVRWPEHVAAASGSRVPPAEPPERAHRKLHSHQSKKKTGTRKGRR